jgi:signal transduction histidine kinase
VNTLPRILIVDDQKDIRTFVKIALGKDKEYEYFEAENGLEAIKIAQSVLPHIIIIDALMPVMDGFEAIDNFRKSECTKNIPILMMSSLDSKDEKVRALQSGISDFISKPFDKIELTIRVNSLVSLYIKFLQEEEKLKEINADLEAKVNQKLEKRLTDIRLTTMGQMATNITHELGTPVTYMQTTLELMEMDIKGCDDANKLHTIIEESIQTLSKGIERIRNIISTTRELSKKSDTQKKELNVYDGVILALQMISTRAKYLCSIYINGVKFTQPFTKPKECFVAPILKQKIEQVWIIILNNACDEFESSKLPYEQRKIDISLFYKDDHLVVKFKDNAKGGIDEAILPHIFEPFVSSKIDSGVGVGLNIAHEIMELHQGKIEAYNEDGFAVFEVTI